MSGDSTARSPIAISATPYQCNGRAVRWASRPATMLPSASPLKNAASTVATACTVTPNTRVSSRNHSCWYTSPHAPETKNSAASKTSTPRSPVSSGEATCTRSTDTADIASHPNCGSRHRGTHRNRRRRRSVPWVAWRRHRSTPRTRASRCTRSSRSGRRGTRCGQRSIGRRRGRRRHCAGPTTSTPRGTDPNCVVGQACGWPVAALLRDTVDVVGAFTLTVPGARGHRYRSVLVGRDERSLVELAAAGAVAVANSADSLSGWISFLATVDASGPGPVARRGDLVRGAHREPASPAGRARRRGVHRRAEHGTHQAPLPRSRGGAARDRHGPLVPSPPVIVPAATPGALVDSLRDAFTWAVADATVGGVAAPSSASTASCHSTTRSTPPRCCSSTSDSLDGHSTTAIEEVMSERSYR